LDSASTAAVTTVGQRKFVAITYTWEIEGQPQDGLIVFPEQGTAATWLDSWHMGDSIWVSQASREGDKVVLRGSYPAPPGPDWGWRIEVGLDEGEKLAIRMFNISPEGQEWPAVTSVYERTPER
jgi:hypothetical protein